MSRVAAASFVGGLLEWYDFYIFAIATALVFGNVFFPPGDPLMNTMRHSALSRLAFWRVPWVA